MSLNLLVFVPLVHHLATPHPVAAANYQMKTGYYMGNGDNEKRLVVKAKLIS